MCRDRARCVTSPAQITSGTAASPTSISGPAITQITARYSTRNGTSPNAVSVSELKKSRTVSSSRSALARTPADTGRSGSLADSSRQ